MKIEYSRVYIYTVGSGICISICAIYADSKEDAFNKLKVTIPLYAPDTVDKIESLDEFLLTAILNVD